MKRITFCLILVSNIINAQYDAIVKLKQVSSSVCQWDSITIAFTFTPANPPQTITTTTFMLVSGTNTYVLWNDNYQAFYRMSKAKTGSDTTYTLKAQVSASASPIAVNVWVQNSNLSSLIKSCYTGINTVSQDTVKPMYYDLYGNAIEPTSGIIMIERLGAQRRKVFIQP